MARCLTYSYTVRHGRLHCVPSQTFTLTYIIKKMYNTERFLLENNPTQTYSGHNNL